MLDTDIVTGLQEEEMDLEMIQDLLGEPNLPPPPSVQDLLDDVVVSVTRSPSPPVMTVAATLEHNYSKVSLEYQF